MIHLTRAGAMMALALLSHRAAAACTEAVSPKVLQQRFDDAEDRYRELDLEGFRTAMDAAARDLPCVSSALDRDLVVQYHRLQGLRAFVLRDADRSEQAFLAARRIAPTWQLPPDLVPSGHPVRERFGALPLDAAGAEAIAPASKGSVAVDGLPAADRPTRAAFVFQHLDAAQAPTTTAYVWPDDPLPTYPQAGPRSARAALIWSGVGALVAGAGTYAAAASTRRTFDDPATPLSELPRLRTTTNALGGVGVGLSAVGAGLLVTGALSR